MRGIGNTEVQSPVYSRRELLLVRGVLVSIAVGVPLQVSAAVTELLALAVCVGVEEEESLADGTGEIKVEFAEEERSGIGHTAADIVVVGEFVDDKACGVRDADVGEGGKRVDDGLAKGVLGFDGLRGFSPNAYAAPYQIEAPATSSMTNATKHLCREQFLHNPL